MKKICLIFIFCLVNLGLLTAQEAYKIKRVYSDYFWKKGEYSQDFYLNVLNQTLCQSNTADEKSIARIVKRTQMQKTDLIPKIIMSLEVFDTDNNQWKSIFSFPKNYANSNLWKDGRDFFSINFPSFNKIVLSGRDSVGFIMQFARNSQDVWTKEFEYRTKSGKIFPTEMQMIGGSLGYAIELNYEGRNFFYRVLKTYDCWRNFREIYRNSARADDPRPEMKLMTFLPEKFGKRMIALRKYWDNKLVLTRDDFVHTQEVDFFDEYDIQKIQLFPDSTIYAFSKSPIYKDKYRLMKSVNYGKEWFSVYTEQGDVIISDFHIFDEMNMVFVGNFFDSTRGLSAYLKITNNGGKTWRYAFYSNETEIFFDFKNSLYTKWAEFKPFGHQLFQYNVGFYNGNRGELVKLFEMEDDKLFISAYSHFNFADSTLFPDDFKTGRKYSILENNWTATDISYPPSLNYYELDPYSFTIKSPNLKLKNDSKYLTQGDTLRWEKEDGAKEYQIKIYQLGILSPNLRKEIFNGTVKDNFLPMPDLSQGYTYLILGKAKSAKYESVTGFLLAREPAEKPLLSLPTLISPSKINWKYSLDTLAETTLRINWEQVPEADWYNLSLFEVNYKYRESNFESKSAKELTPLILESNTTFNYLEYKGLKPNRTYEIVLYAENDKGISKFTTFYFVTAKALGIFPLAVDKSAFYPNPAGDIAHLKLDESFSGDLSVFAVDLLGNSTQLWQGSADETLGIIDLNLNILPAGSYTILLDSPNQREALKIIKN